MQSRIAARDASTEVAVVAAKLAIAEAKEALGESGAVWWDDCLL